MYKIAINLIGKSEKYQSALKVFLERKDIQNVILCEYGNPSDTCSLLERTIRVLNDPTENTRNVIYNGDQTSSLFSFNVNRWCGVLVAPVWSDNEVVFKFIPKGPFQEVAKRLLDNGTKLVPAARMRYAGNRDDIREITAIDLIPSILHRDFAIPQHMHPFISHRR